MTTALEELDTSIRSNSKSSIAHAIDTYTRRVIREELAELVASAEHPKEDDRAVSLNAVLALVDHIEHFFDGNPFDTARSTAQQIAGWKAAAVNMRGQVQFLAGVTPYARERRAGVSA